MGKVAMHCGIKKADLIHHRCSRPRRQRSEGSQLLVRGGARLGRGIAGALDLAQLLPDGAVGSDKASEKASNGHTFGTQSLIAC